MGLLKDYDSGVILWYKYWFCLIIFFFLSITTVSWSLSNKENTSWLNLRIFDLSFLWSVQDDGNEFRTIVRASLAFFFCVKICDMRKTQLSVIKILFLAWIKQPWVSLMMIGIGDKSLSCIDCWYDTFDHLPYQIKGNAALLGLQKDLKLTAAEYNWLGTIFYGLWLIFYQLFFVLLLSWRPIFLHLTFQHPPSALLQK